LRIGVSAAKGLCFALDKPLIAIDTLEILAHQIEAERGYVVPMLDARRMEVYSAIFNSRFEWVRGVASEILHADSFIEQLQVDTVYFIGNGVEKTKSVIKHKNAVFIEGKLPSANEMGHLAEAKYKISDTEDVAYFEPYYLKDFIALKKKS
jgi:tRNA threonylcarbamoyladenosine biosynthesis protein TsaB